MVDRRKEEMKKWEENWKSYRKRFQTLCVFGYELDWLLTKEIWEREWMCMYCMREREGERVMVKYVLNESMFAGRKWKRMRVRRKSAFSWRVLSTWWGLLSLPLPLFLPIFLFLSLPLSLTISFLLTLTSILNFFNFLLPLQMHYGHMNAFRLGGKLGTTLIVGVNSSSSITQCKVLVCVCVRTCLCGCMDERLIETESMEKVFKCLSVFLTNLLRYIRTFSFLFNVLYSPLPSASSLRASLLWWVTKNDVTLWEGADSCMRSVDTWIHLRAHTRHLNTYRKYSIFTHDSISLKQSHILQTHSPLLFHFTLLSLLSPLSPLSSLSLGDWGDTVCDDSWVLREDHERASHRLCRAWEWPVYCGWEGVFVCVCVCILQFMFIKKIMRIPSS